MNRSFLLATAVTLLVVGYGSVARADDRAEIEALYVRLQQALKNQTPEDTLALETADFKEIQAGGKAISGKALVQQMKQENAGVKSVKDVRIAIRKAAIAGKRARVTTDFSYAVEIEDKDGHMGPKGATHEMSMSGIVKNDLVKTTAGWKFKTMEQGTGKMLVDGKTVPQMSTGTRKSAHKTR